MKAHKASELRFSAQILAADGVTVLSTLYVDIEDLMGRRLEQAQLVAAETSHRILMRTGDATALTPAGYVQYDGVLYIVDYTRDPRFPRPNMWLEVFCHVERTNS